MNQIGEQILMYRKNLHMSQEELAFRARIGLKTLQEIESGQILPGTQTLLKFSTILDMPICYIDDNRDRQLIH